MAAQRIPHRWVRRTLPLLFSLSTVATAFAQTLPAAKPEDVFKGKIIITKNRRPMRFSSEGQFVAALQKNKTSLGNTPAFVETDIAFHLVLAEIPRNPIFTSLHAAMAGWLKEQRFMTGDPTSQGRAVRAHARICKAVLARDPDAAERAMKQHLDEVSRFYWQAVESGA